MPRPPKDAACADPPSYEAAMAELEQIAAAMEGGQMPLEKLLESYQRGARLLEYCRARLKAVEDQVKVLEGERLEPWTGA
jgi:exodeoxyribonuclease VII small subunit